MDAETIGIVAAIALGGFSTVKHVVDLAKDAIRHKKEHSDPPPPMRDRLPSGDMGLVSSMQCDATMSGVRMAIEKLERVMLERTDRIQARLDGILQSYEERLRRAEISIAFMKGRSDEDERKRDSD